MSETTRRDVPESVEKERNAREERKPPPLPLWKSFRFYTGFFRPYGRETTWAFVFNTLTMLPALLMPICLKVVIDRFIPAADKAGLYGMLILLVALLTVHILYTTACRAVFMRVVKQVSRDLRNLIVSRLQILSLSYFHSRDRGGYYSKIMVDAERAEQFANQFMFNVFRAVVMLVFLVLILVATHPDLLLTLSLTLPVFWALLWVFKSSMYKSRHRERMAREDLSISINQFLQTSLLARQHGHEGFERWKVDTTNAQVVAKSVDAESQVGLFSALTGSVSFSIYFIMVVYCGLLVIDRQLTLGDMILFTGYVGQLTNHVLQIINIYPIVTLFNESIASIKELLDAPDIEYNQGKQTVEQLRGDIRFENVSFAYDNGSYALHEVSVHVPPGQTVALVGHSGSGKSTFVNLLLGLYRTKQGIISIDDVPINQIDMRTLRRHVGVVSQAPILFSGTIRENILHAYRDVPMDRVIDAAKHAYAHDFIVKLPEGYESYVGENGVLLSGGQCQRIALARTILRDPRILILDEATSALDSESEFLVQSAIEGMIRSITTFVIAHRLSTIRNADQILVFRDGRIVERGTHETLAANEVGEYAKLLRYQSIEGFHPEEASRLAAETAPPAPPTERKRTPSGRF